MDEAIPVLRVADAEAAVSWYARLGYVREWEHRFTASLPAFVSIARPGGARLFLSEHDGDGTANTLVYIRVADVDAIASEFNVGVVVQPWAREVHLVDTDGNRLRLGTRHVVVGLRRRRTERRHSGRL